VDPITIAIGSFTAIKSAVSAGREIQDLVGEIGKLYSALDQTQIDHQKKKDSTISADEQALNTWIARRKAQEIEDELRTYIQYTLGKNAWEELVQVRVEIKKKRREQAVQEARIRREKRRQSMAIFGLLFGAVVVFGTLMYMFNAMLENRM
jgi:hypothetical protein